MRGCAVLVLADAWVNAAMVLLAGWAAAHAYAVLADAGFDFGQISDVGEFGFEWLEYSGTVWTDFQRGNIENLGDARACWLSSVGEVSDSGFASWGLRIFLGLVATEWCSLPCLFAFENLEFGS